MTKGIKKLNVVVYSIHYSPEQIGIGVFNRGMAEYLARHGHHVTVVTAFPWYPSWKINPPYTGRWSMVESEGAVVILRSFVPSLKKVNARTRVVHETAFALSSCLHLLKLFFKKIDAVVVVCPPLQLGFWAWLFCRVKRIPFIFHIQDLQIDAAADLGLITNRFIVGFLRHWERFLFRRAAILSTISDGMKKRIEAKGIFSRPVLLFPNWVDTQFLTPMSRDNAFRKLHGIGRDKFLVLYAGNIGEKQGVDILLDVAFLTKDRKDILYLIVGEGVGLSRLKQSLQDSKPEQIRLLPLQPREKLPAMLAAADLSLVIQKKGVGDFLMPSKLWNIMGSSRPVVAAAQADCELARCIQKSGCGEVVPPENPKLLAGAILKFYADPALRERCGRMGRFFVETHLSYENIMADFEKVLMDMKS
ncbi:MAG: Alpha-D-kanosaminyltransferase [Syntrophorhabdaceae bacterium PtaU1.Bin034]|nr:MAG: Alpha-D-kanosaminyltransferase [Syntrophorhabdaceae bacterium PtaU1.Bin034]